MTLFYFACLLEMISCQVSQSEADLHAISWNFEEM